MINVPKKNERWTIGSYNNIMYLGVGRDFTEQKFLIFEKPKGGFFLITKDQFYSPGVFKEREDDS